MRFVDRVRILAKAGDGGRGVVAWRREAMTPMGGPAGGDGGRGGSVILQADESMSTLLDLKYRQELRAGSGEAGQNKGKYGRGAEDLIVRVPVGTVVYFEGIAQEGEPPPWHVEGDDEGRGASSMQNIYVVGGDEEPLDAEAEAEERAALARARAALEAGELESGDLGDVESSDDEVDATADEGRRADGEPEHAEDEDEDEDQEDDELFEADSEEEPEDVALGERKQDRRRRRRAHRRPRTKATTRDPATEGVDPTTLSPGDVVGDLVFAGQRLVIARGGRGGRGNIHFKSSTNRAPDRAESGTPGDSVWLRLELKLLADVGIVGFPNVGKSTLIRNISRARPEVGDYPFTTLVPHLGVVSIGGERSFVVADVPGLVRGASEGRGLGLRFLRHLERTRVLLHLLAPDPADDREPYRDLQALEEELAAYGAMFEGRPRVVALNKIDTDAGREAIANLRRRLRRHDIPLFPICAHTGEGVPALLEALWRRLELVKARERSVLSGDVPTSGEGPASGEGPVSGESPTGDDSPTDVTPSE